MKKIEEKLEKLPLVITAPLAIIQIIILCGWFMGFLIENDESVLGSPIHLHWNISVEAFMIVCKYCFYTEISIAICILFYSWYKSRK